MLQLIIGVKGTGKTKQLIHMVNDALSTTKGDVVCIEKGDKLKYDVKYQCRLIDTEQYFIGDAEALYGFIAGIIASNHDVTDLFVDSALKICKNKIDDFDIMLDKLEQISSRYGFKIVMTSSLPADDATETMKKYLVSAPESCTVPETSGKN